MTFCLQLRLILWKNFIVRRRQKVRIIMDLIWPLFLFLILMWVRSRGLRSEESACYLTEKALPSTGTLPFFQSFVCTFSNPCHKTFNESEVRSGDINPVTLAILGQQLSAIMREGRKIYKRDSLSRTQLRIDRLSQAIRLFNDTTPDYSGTIIVRDALTNTEDLYEEILSKNITLAEEDFSQLLNITLNVKKLDIGHLPLLVDQSPKSIFCNESFMKEIVMGDEYDSIKSSLCVLTEDQFIILQNIFKKYLKGTIDPKEFEYYIRQNLGNKLTLSEWQNIKKSYKNMEKNLVSSEFYSDIKNDVFDEPPPIVENLQSSPGGEDESKNASKAEKAVALIYKFLCDEDVGEVVNQVFSMNAAASALDSLQDQFESRSNKNYQYDNETAPVCNGLFEMIETNPATALLWRIVKPFFVGKILYTPVTPVTKRIMERVNATLTSIFDLKKFMGMIPVELSAAANRTSFFLQPDGLKEISDFLKTDLGRSIVGSQLARETENNESLSLDEMQNMIDRLHAYSRVQEANHQILLQAQNNFTLFLTCLVDNKVEGISVRSEAEKQAMKMVHFNKLWGLVVFESPGNNELAPFVSYTLRMNTERVDNTEYVVDLIMRPGPRARPSIDLKYVTYGFIFLQDALDRSIIQEHTSREDLPGMVLQQFPYPCYIKDDFVLAISRTFPLFMVLSFVYTCAMIVKSIVYEKEERLKEVMRVMGLSNGVLWLGWFIESILPLTVTILMLTLILKFGNILIYSDPTVIYFFLFSYCLTTISLGFLISVFFSRANLAAASAGVVFFIVYLPYPFVVRWMFQMESWHKLFLSLSSNVAFGLGCSYLALYEERGTGIGWNEIATSPIYGDECNLLQVIGMLYLDFIIYLLLTWYVEAVFPGQYGIPRPWYFLFTHSYWTGKDSSKIFVSPLDSTTSQPSGLNEDFEAEPEGLSPGVKIRNLRKVYSNGKVALHDINLTFYENQITSFLGHNGAGKTTTISILTGMYPPTSGTAIINGYDIKTDMDEIRNNLGVCPQHNVLFNKLTVEEHLWFYGCLRGKQLRGEEQLRQEIEQMLVDLDIPHKRDTLSNQLSGGMQRKLSIAVAFIGGSRTVILDEPTSGVDPYSRRSIWELLLKYKTNRTLVLTTHYMDEADLLGDRIAIIANGRVQCCGSGIFLRERFGTGFRLTFELKNAPLSTVSSFSLTGGDGDAFGPVITGKPAHELEKYIQTKVPEAKYVERLGTEVTFSLPKEMKLTELSVLCDSLDSNRKKLGFISYGISDTSLEEIFLKVADKDPSNVTDLKEVSVQINGSRVTYSEVPCVEVSTKVIKTKQFKSYLRQYLALHIKRLHHTRRNRKALFSELILPALFIALALAVSTIFPKLKERPPLELDPFVYPPPRYMFYSEDSPGDRWMTAYLNSMKGPEGLGTMCIVEPGGERNSSCHSPGYAALSSGYVRQMSLAQDYSRVKCSCKSGAQLCPSNIGEPLPPSSKLASGDTMYDLTGQDVPDWIINTWPKYEMRRYGGYSFGVTSKVPNLQFPRASELLKFQEENMNQIMKTVDRFLPLPLAGPGKSSNYVKVWSYTVVKKLEASDDVWENMLFILCPDIARKQLQVWFNNKGWISSPAYLNAINNVILRASLPSTEDPANYGIKLTNHPLNFTGKQFQIELIRQGGVSLLHAVAVIFALSFVPASFTVYLIEERISQSKHLQLVSGVNRLIYWFQTFSWDLIAYTVAAFLAVLVFLCYDEQAYVSQDNLPGLIALFLLYGWSCIPLMYPISFWFSVPSTAYVALACGNLFIGIITTVTTFVLGAFVDEELNYVHDVLKEVFLLFPHFCLGDGLIKMATNHLTTAALMHLDINYKKNIFDWDFLGKKLFAMTLFGIFFFLVTLAVEFDVITLISYLIYKSERDKDKQKKGGDMKDEEDVGEERRRIERGDHHQDILVIKDLTKIYRGNKVPSVDRITLGVGRGECFGLLGLNGAGKTTTFKMLTGAEEPTDGDATVGGFSVRGERDDVRALLGYCPQFDALDPLLTVREHLVLYSKIRNIPSKEVDERVDSSIMLLGLGHYSNRLAGTLSGGNKRKLSTAIALIGRPPVVFLDEPTSGMDPKARRFLWTRIQEVVKTGGCVVLTSHSMEECQALCTRLTVMVNGRFRCLGTPQHLKNKYGSGYLLILRCEAFHLPAVKELMKKELPSARILEEHHTKIKYEVSQDFKLSRVLQEMEKAKTSHLIIDYSVTQTTLEEVFIRFANEQGHVLKHDPWYHRLRDFCIKCCGRCKQKESSVEDPEEVKGERKYPESGGSLGGRWDGGTSGSSPSMGFKRQTPEEEIQSAEGSRV